MSDVVDLDHFLSWKSKFDASLEQHLETAPTNAEYVTPTVQSELTEGCEAEILEAIVKKINSAKVFTVGSIGC